MAADGQEAVATDQLKEPLKAFISSFLTTTTDAQARINALEISLRTETLKLCQAAISSSSAEAAKDATTAISDLQEFWKETVRVTHFVVQQATTEQEEEGAEKPADGTMEVEKQESKLSSPASSSPYKNLATVTSQIRKLPVTLLDDILDTLSTDAAYSFWKCCVTFDSLLFSNLLWNPTPKVHPCWLPFLKATNKFLKQLQDEESAVQAAQVLLTLSTVYPMSEKSATKVWGSHNADNSTVWEDEIEFHTTEDDEAAVGIALKAAPTTTDTRPPDTQNYSFYQTFWKLQHDFRNPNGIVVADFLQRLSTVVRSLQSHKNTATAQSSATRSTSSSTIAIPYLTASRLLPIQLSDASFCTVLLSQFFMCAHHLMSQVPTLRAQLQQQLDVAEKKMPAEQLTLVRHVLEGSEPAWRTWKQKKCLPDLEQKQLPQPPPLQAAALPETSDRKRKRDAAAVEQEDDSYTWTDLPSVSSKMRDGVPVVKDHLENYVEALDPEAGIEAEYHPKNDSVFAWRALRLLSAETMQDFGLIHPTGDFEGMVRSMYATNGVEIPGDGPAPYEYEESEDEEPPPPPEAMETVAEDTNEEADVPMKEADNNAEEALSKDVVEVAVEDSKAKACDDGEGEEKGSLKEEIKPKPETKQNGAAESTASNKHAESRSTQPKQPEENRHYNREDSRPRNRPTNGRDRRGDGRMERRDAERIDMRRDDRGEGRRGAPPGRGDSRPDGRRSDEQARRDEWIRGRGDSRSGVRGGRGGGRRR